MNSVNFKAIKLCFKLAVKELLNHKKFSFFLIINLTLGLLSFLIIDSLSVSLNSYITTNSRTLRSADITLSGRRPLTESETKVILSNPEVKNLASSLDYFTMMESKGETRLVRAQVISEGYPFYGEFTVKDFDGNIIPWEQVSREMQTEPVVMIAPELTKMFSDEPIENNETVKVGNTEFKVRYLLEKDVEQGIGFRSLSQKVLIAEKQHITDLSEKGNSIRYRYYIEQQDLDLPSKEIAKEIAESLSALNESRPLQVRSHDQSGGILDRVFGYVYNYLGLISLVTLFLSGIGAFYLFRSFIYQKLKDIAIMENLGMKKWQTFLEAIFQLLFLGIGAVAFTVLIYVGLKSFIPLLLGDILPADLIIGINLQSILFIFIIALMGPLLFTFPLILATKELKPIYLIKKSFQLESNKKIYLWGFLPSIVSFYLLSIWISGSFLRGNVFTAVFLLSIVVIYFLGFFYWKVFDWLKAHLNFTFAMIVKNLSRNRSSSSFYFFAIATSVLLISLIPQLEFSIRKELSQPKGYVIPSLFLFNLQKSEVEPLKTRLDEWGEKIEFITPFISAELTKKNGVEVTNSNNRFDQEVEQEERRRSSRLQRINLTYRSQLSPSETIVVGKPFSDVKRVKSADEIVEISIEKNYAEEMGFEMGDELSFKLIEVPFEFTGKIVNFREVKWNSFQPNFFIMVSPGLLEEVPHQYVASISGISGDQKVDIQNKIFREFPNISIIDILDLVNQALGIIKKMGIILLVMALFCFILGMFILFTIINHEVLQKQKEINLFKALGAKFHTIYLMVIGEHIVLGFLAIVTGFFPSIILNYALGQVFFRGAFSFSPILMMQIFLIIFASIAVISYLGSRKALQSKPISLLKSD